MEQPPTKTAPPVFKYIIIFWALILTALIASVILLYSISKGAFGELPQFEDLENPKSYLASEVYTSDHIMLGKYYLQNRSNVRYEELSENLINALVATEDVRYYDHAGIDIRGLFRVMVKTVILQQKAGGGSTISQQLAKNLFHNIPESKLERILQKLKEWIISVKLEKSYTKKEILTMYLNTVPFGDNAYGIKAAAKTFFNKTPDSLTIEESAVMIGMLKGTTLYNPRRNPETSLKRRNVVISQMNKYGFLSDAEKDSLIAIPITLNFKRQDHNEGLAPYFREHLRMQLLRWCRENVKVDGSQYNLYKDGLKIYTTLNHKMQQYAEDAVREHLKAHQEEFFKHWEGYSHAPFDKNLTKAEIERIFNRAIRRSERYRSLKKQGLDPDSIKSNFNKPVSMRVFSWEGEIDTVMSPLDSIKYYKYFLQAGFMIMEPQTGYIRAWVGGINHKYFKYDHVNPRAKRQVGSTFKPFVYTKAVHEGWSPCFEVPNVPITFEAGKFGIQKPWTPKNSAGDEYGGMRSLQEGLAKSTNVITARLMYELGPQPVIDLINNMGIDTAEIEPYPSICLGTPDLSVYEMVGAYGTFVNKGFYTKPIMITRIEDKNGNLIKEFPPEKKEVIDEQTAYIMLQLLKNVVNHGTGAGLRFRFKLYNEMGGKTGTTQNHSDGWYMGVLPQLVAGAWVGCEDRSAHFRSIRLGQGARMAMPIFGLFMQKVYADKSLSILYDAKFEEPQQPLSIELDCSKYKQKRPGNSSGFGSEWDKVNLP